MKLCLGAFGFKINVVVATIWSFFIELVRICIVRCWDVFLKLTTRPFFSPQCFDRQDMRAAPAPTAGSQGPIAGNPRFNQYDAKKHNTQNVQTNHRYCTVFVHFVANCTYVCWYAGRWIDNLLYLVEVQRRVGGNSIGSNSKAKTGKLQNVLVQSENWSRHSLPFISTFEGTAVQPF